MSKKRGMVLQLFSFIHSYLQETKFFSGAVVSVSAYGREDRGFDESGQGVRIFNIAVLLFVAKYALLL
jgi:hypothetical protein